MTGTSQRTWISNTRQQTVVCSLFALSNQPDIVVQVSRRMAGPCYSLHSSSSIRHRVVYSAFAYNLFQIAYFEA